MNWLVKYGIKKYALSFVNTALNNYKDNISKVLDMVDVAILKAQAVLDYLKSLREKLADNKIDDSEVEAITAETSALVAKVLG